MNLWSIAPENDLLAVLAAAVADGVLVEGGSAFALQDWTILVPTRRAARLLSRLFLTRSGRRAMVLPRIRPIGDADEEDLADFAATDDLLPSLTTAGLTHLLLELVTAWARRNPQAGLADEIVRWPQQALQLALSLQHLLNEVETEETGLASLPLAYDLELAGHRAALLDLLDVLVKDLPQRLGELKRLTPSARRNQVLRLEARQIASGLRPGPLVAAGSTGTNPATRELLQAIALKEHGAVVLPGLDLSLDEESWAAISPQHPQHAMKSALDQWQVKRRCVQPLGEKGGPKTGMLSDMMRPTSMTVDPKPQGTASAAMQDVELVEARDRHEEAHVIALRLRKFIAIEDGRAALITPDRDLARRVEAALRQWNITIDDSGGQRLADQPLGSLLALLIRARLSGFSSASLLAILHHPLAHFGTDSHRVKALREMLDICCFRGLPASQGLDLLDAKVDAARGRATDRHAHPMLTRLTPQDWEELKAFAARIHSALGKSKDGPRPFGEHVRGINETLKNVAAEVAFADGGNAVSLLLEALSEDDVWRRPMDFAIAAVVLLHHLAEIPVRPRLADEARISILGLPEARLVPLKLAILGGLNDGIWPQITEPGPWLNRSMRKTLGLSQPERAIGITAHDFVHGFGRRKVMVTWSRRIGSKPAMPSRWILKLRSTLHLSGLPPEQHLSHELIDLTRRLSAAPRFAPWPRPAVRPPVSIRPTSFSVTEIETLVRDSYAIFARRILQLEPLEDSGASVDARLRGTLVHAAIGAWLADEYHADDSRNLAQLLLRGEEAFRPFHTIPEVARLWWPRFERMARALIPIERQFRQNLSTVISEAAGTIAITTESVVHHLRARADRIDVLSDGTLRILDYKTGQAPSWSQVVVGYAPQLSLEAVIAGQGGFANLAKSRVSDVGYVQVGGGKEAAKAIMAASKLDVQSVATLHREGLTRLLRAYQTAETPYVPRHNLTEDNERSNFDHLSRRGEWELALRSRP